MIRVVTTRGPSCLLVMASPVWTLQSLLPSAKTPVLSSVRSQVEPPFFLFSWPHVERIHGWNVLLDCQLHHCLIVVYYMCTFECLWSVVVLSTPWWPCLHLFSGALTPLSAAAAAAAAAGRVALAGQAGSGGVLLVSNLNEEVSQIYTSSPPSSKMDHLRLSPLSDLCSLVLIHKAVVAISLPHGFHCPHRFHCVFCLTLGIQFEFKLD